MIQVATNLLRVMDRQGAPALLDMSQLEHDLADAFRNQGAASSVWLAGQIALTVEDRVRASDSTMLRDVEVDGMVITALRASGFEEVAAEFARNRRHDLISQTGKQMRKWTLEEMRGVLQRSLPLAKERVEELAGKLQQAMAALKFEMATEPFLVDMAIHFLQAGMQAKTAKAPANNWQDRLQENTRSLISSGVLWALPMLSAFPKATVVVDVVGVVSRLAGGWMAEFSLCQAFDSLAPAVLDLLNCLQEELRHHSKNDPRESAMVVFPGFHAYVKKSFSLPEEGYSFQCTMMKLLEERIVSQAEFPVTVYCR